jgi:hypothetical protein
VSVCAIGGLLAGVLFPGYSALASAMPFLIPVGASLLGSQIVESATAELRFVLRPEILHRARFIVVLVDVLSQLLGLLLGGVTGLVVALIALACGRIAVTAAVLMLSRRDRWPAGWVLNMGATP